MHETREEENEDKKTLKLTLIAMQFELWTSYRRIELQFRRPEEVLRWLRRVQVLHLAQEIWLDVRLSLGVGLSYLKLPGLLPGGAQRRHLGRVSRDVVHVLLQLRRNHRCHALPHDQHLCAYMTLWWSEHPWMNCIGSLLHLQTIYTTIAPVRSGGWINKNRKRCRRGR